MSKYIKLQVPYGWLFVREDVLSEVMRNLTKQGIPYTEGEE